MVNVIRLAVRDPEAAVLNADNYGFFVQDQP
jgi:hypothetical protein